MQSSQSTSVTFTPKTRESDLKPEATPPPNASAPAHITSGLDRGYWRMGGADDQRTNPNFPLLWPRFNQFVSFPHEVSGNHVRSHSPIEHGIEYHSKFGHLLDVFSKHGTPIGGGHSGFPHHSNMGGHLGHSMHPNQHGHPPPPHSRPMSAQSHSHPPHPDIPVPGQSSLPVFPSHHSRSVNPPNIENMSRVSPRPHIDASTGLPYGYPHLHSHLHTHTHLHLHPSDSERHSVPREHPPPTSSAHPAPGHLPSLGMPHKSSLLRHEELLHHIQQDPRMRSALLGPGGIPTREGAISPGMVHEYLKHDPAAYHFWLSQVARSHQDHMFTDPHNPSPHQNLRLLAEHEEYVRHMRSVSMDPKFKMEHDRGIAVPERGLPIGERGIPRGEHVPSTPAAYLEHIMRLHGRLTPPTPMSVKPVTIDLCED